MKKRRPELRPLPVSEYGNLDISTGCPSGVIHVDLPRLGPLCKRLGIECAKAIVGWTEYGPVLSGVVIWESDFLSLQAAIDKKKREEMKNACRLSIPAALFTLNRRAKRCRDLAQTYYQYGMHGLAGQMRREKEGIYALKGQVLHYLIDDGILTGGEFHRFQGGIWAEVLKGDGFVFHRPCPTQIDAAVVESASVESKPKGSKEPTLAVARSVVAKYLSNKPHVAIYRWPPKARSLRTYWEDDEDVFDFDDDEATDY